MKYDPTVHDRRSIRLRGYDYASEGAYHVVMRTKDGLCVFGEVEGIEMKLSPIGRIAESCWLEIRKHFQNVELDQYIVMPNHIHCIVAIKAPERAIQKDDISRKGLMTEGNSSGKGSIHETPMRKGLMNQTPTKEDLPGWPLMKDPRITLGKIVRAFKARCTKLIHDAGSAQFQWQRDFYDHIIRDGKDLDRIRKYILDNPMNWGNDQNFPENIRMNRMHEGEEDWSALD